MSWEGRGGGAGRTLKVWSKLNNFEYAALGRGEQGWRSGRVRPCTEGHWGQGPIQMWEFRARALYMKLLPYPEQNERWFAGGWGECHKQFVNVTENVI